MATTLEASRIDVLVVGAGPAGTVAATVLARAGATVRVVDRASFPRPKLCGDTINPGTLSRLDRLAIRIPREHGLRLDGMVVTGANAKLGVRISRREPATVVRGTYPAPTSGLAISRHVLDQVLLDQAIAAGVQFDAGIHVCGAVVDDSADGRRVTGVRLTAASRRSSVMRARVVLAADGRRSRLGFELGLLRQPARPRRWAVGAYLDGVRAPALGEMHIRPDGYIGLSPLPGGGTNVCVVTAHLPRPLGDAGAWLMSVLRADPLLGERLGAAVLAGPVTVLGPLAIEPTGRTIDGLLSAGDAAGFIDPMTGDGLRFAIEGAELAAAAALRALEHGWSGVHARLRGERERAFASKWRFNRCLRTIVSSPRAIRAAALGARVVPGMVRALISHAGDVGLASRPDQPAGIPGDVVHTAKRWPL